MRTEVCPRCGHEFRVGKPGANAETLTKRWSSDRAKFWKAIDMKLSRLQRQGIDITAHDLRSYQQGYPLRMLWRAMQFETNSTISWIDFDPWHTHIPTPQQLNDAFAANPEMRARLFPERSGV